VAIRQPTESTAPPILRARCSSMCATAPTALGIAINLPLECRRSIRCLSAGTCGDALCPAALLCQCPRADSRRNRSRS